MIRRSAVVTAAAQLEESTRALGCDPECERCRGTLLAVRAIRDRRGAA